MTDINWSGRLVIVLFISFLIALGYRSHAQNKNIFGVLAGMNVSNLSDYDGKTALGISGGIYWEWRFSKSFSFQSNFLYSQRGELQDNPTPKLRLHYVNLPLMAKYYVTDNFQVMTGIYWDFLLGVESSIYSTNDFKKSDLGIPIGVSYDLSRNLQIGLSYNIGLMDVSDSQTTNFSPKNNWANLTIAYLLRRSEENQN